MKIVVCSGYCVESLQFRAYLPSAQKQANAISRLEDAGYDHKMPVSGREETLKQKIHETHHISWIILFQIN
ncbi:MULTISPECIES: hypothetical protein [Bacillus]|uniref:hypothetical protein n=1 Tax=Bacillus sp. SKDU12 TaxID=1337053 RepID=UPI00138A0331|nr:hypothetical protein BTW01_04320 [Bacillus sp. SKDU12]